jgi:6-phosphofructokinase 1
MVVEGKFGMMASLRGNEIVTAPLEEAVGTLKTVDKSLYKIAEIFFG